MGQHYSAQGDGASATSLSQNATEGKIKSDSGDLWAGRSWRNGTGASMSSHPGQNDSDTAEYSTVRPRVDMEVGRMSIRAAIDTFIENCLSANNDSSPDSDEKTIDEIRSFSAQNSGNEDTHDLCGSSVCNDAESSKDSTGNLSNIISSETDNEVKIVNDKNSDLEDKKLVAGDLKTDEGIKNDIKEAVITEEAAKESKKINLAENSPSASSSATQDKQHRTRTGSEKQTFSAYLQERLKEMNIVNCEGLAQLECQGQMLMWEMANRPRGLLDTASSSSSRSSSPFPSGPVRLQTLIDRVLDSSLRSQDLLPGRNVRKERGETALEKHEVRTSGTLCSAETAPRELQERSEKIASVKEKNPLCFKDHIEKVLLESFLSFEEEERKDILKVGSTKPSGEASSVTVNSFNGGCSREVAETHSSMQSSMNKEGTLSVQDIVDQVISQTEMISKLLTPSTRNIGTSSSSSSSYSDSTTSSSGMHSRSAQGLKFRSASQSSQALLEAQRHAVQKEHQSISNMGRKRGRPRLNSQVNNTVKSKSHRDRVQLLAQNPFQISDHSHTDHLRQDYTSQASHQVGVSSALMSLAPPPPPATLMFQKRSHMRQMASEPTLVGSASSSYHFTSHENLNQPQADQQLPFHSQHHHFQPLDSGQRSSLNAPPPLILANHVSENISGSSSGARLMPVYHTPSKSCSCQSCITHFSPQPTNPPSRMHHHFTKLERVADLGSHHQLYHPQSAATSVINSTGLYSQPVLASTEPSCPVKVTLNQGHPAQGTTGPAFPAVKTTNPVFPAAQNLRHNPGLTVASREAISGHHFDSRDHSPGRHHQGDVPQVRTDRISASDPRYPDTKITSKPNHMSYEAAPLKQIIVAKDSSPGGHKRDQDFSQPLDLSVKPKSAHGCDTGAGPSTQDAVFVGRRSPFRTLSSNHRLKSQGQSMDYEQRGASDHHLQRLENSVDRFFPQSDPPAHNQATSQQVLEQKQRTAPLPAPPHQAHLAGGRGVVPGQPHSDIQVAGQLLSDSHESSGQRSSFQHRQQPGSYTYSVAPGSHQLQLMPPQHHNQSSFMRQPQTASSGGAQYHSRSQEVDFSPSLSDNLDFPQHPQPGHRSQVRAMPASSYHRSPGCGVDSENGAVPVASSPAHSQNSPSPEDIQKQNVSKHEPIQNIIGNHPSSDILYLICRLCRQTYGSPYGFRKHFRQQHGFEPKADHTIIQTISATKTAMAHTGQMDQSEKPLLLQSDRDEKFSGHNLHQHNQSVKPQSSDQLPAPPGQTLCHRTSPADNKLDVAKELPHNAKYLECPECGQTFQLNDFGSYKRHCRQHNLRRSSGPYACHECQRSFSEPGQLQEHLDSHSSFTPSVCGICHTFFSSPNYLAGHLQAAHEITCGGEGVENQPGHLERENDRMLNHIQKPEHPLQLETSSGPSEIKKCSQQVRFSPLISENNINPVAPCHSVVPLPPSSIELKSTLSAPVINTVLPLAHSAVALSDHSSTLSSKQQQLTTSTSSSVVHSMIQLSSNSRHAGLTLTSGSSHLFTVHTPKGLEIQKLPADAVVTTASPDSSYDETKWQSDSESRNGTQAPPERHDITGSSETSSCVAITEPQQKDFSDQSLPENRSDKESSCSERPVSVSSYPATSPGGDDVDTFYKHKKYSRYRKRLKSDDSGCESKLKSQKVEGSDFPQDKDQAPSSVSSTVNACVTVRDCESSCPTTDDSSVSMSVASSNESMKPDNLLKVQEAEKRSDSSDGDIDKGDDSSRFSGASKKGSSKETGLKFKWDRQTRSQSSKASQSLILKLS